LATAFSGKPAAEGKPFAELTEPQQSALRAIAELDGDCWNIGSLMQDVMTSYGFPFWGKERLKEYIAGSESASNCRAEFES
jgi:hypothetical protein